MAAFTIFHHETRDVYVSVYDRHLPTGTGIGEKPEWVPVFHGEATDIWDRIAQKKAFEAERRKKSC